MYNQLFIRYASYILCLNKQSYTFQAQTIHCTIDIRMYVLISGDYKPTVVMHKCVYLYKV